MIFHSYVSLPEGIPPKVGTLVDSQMLIPRFLERNLGIVDQPRSIRRKITPWLEFHPPFPDPYLFRR